MCKIKQSSKHITPFGGLYFIDQALTRKGIKRFLIDQIGWRDIRAKYSNADAVMALLYNCLVNGEFISDLQALKSKAPEALGDLILSPDSVEYICKQLQTPTETRTTVCSKGIEVHHQINYNNKMNQILIALAKKTNQLKSGEQGYVLDYDNVVVATEKQDTKVSYKGHKGYHPNIAFIGRLPLHIENHNGNTPARFAQGETLQRCFQNLQQAGIRIESFRADSASYQKEVVDLVKKQARYFYIRNMKSPGFYARCGQAQQWKTIRVGLEEKEVASIDFAPFGGEEQYRVVVTRTLKKDGQYDIESGTAYDYYGIITNNYEKSEEEVILFYNQRGDGENSNRYLLNDFNWHRLPFPGMDTNTVFMYIMAMCAQLFEWIKEVLVANQTPDITKSMRVKRICLHYIAVAATFITHARQKIFQVFSTNTYAPSANLSPPAEHERNREPLHRNTHSPFY